jgi:predicted small secreted protein
MLWFGYPTPNGDDVVKKLLTPALLLACAVPLSACSTLTGAGIGAASGAGVAAATNGNVEKGAAVGGVGGAVVGTVVGD